MRYFIYFFFLYIIDFFFNIFLYKLLDITIYLLNHPYTSDIERRKLLVNFFFFKEVEERKKKKNFTEFNKFYFSIRLINKYVTNTKHKDLLINYLYLINKFFYHKILAILNCVYFDWGFFFFVNFHLEVYKKGFKNYVIVCVFIFFSIFRINLNIKSLVLNFFTNLIVEMFIALISFLRFFILSFFEYILTLMYVNP